MIRPFDFLQQYSENEIDKEIIAVGMLTFTHKC